MRSLLLLLAASIFAASSSYACNQTYDMCMKTAQLAADACTNSKSSTCACSAGKQLLACYAECPQDQKMFDAEEKQLARVAELCKAPGAEHEASHSVIANTPAAAIRAASNTALHSSLHASASTSNHNPAATTSESTIPAVAMIPEPIHVQSAPPALEESHAHKARKDGSSMVHKDDTENSAGSFEASSLAALVPVVLALIVNSSI